MKLCDLFKDIKYTLVKGNMELTIDDIVYDSRKAKDGVMFMAIPGSEVDGHDYISDAIKNGAKVILVSKDIDI